MSAGGEGISVPRPVIWLGLAALIVAVVTLVMLSLQSGGIGDDSEGERELKIAPLAVEPEPSPAPESTEEPPPVATPSAALLAAMGSETMWRTTGGTCVVGADDAAGLPVIERSDDASTWVPVTPTNFEVREVRFLSAISPIAAEAVVLTGPECAQQIIRTFTGGEFWEPYDDSIRGAVFLAAGGAEVIAPEGAIASPCEVLPRNLSGQADRVVAMVCEGQLQWSAPDGWVAGDLPGLVSASLDAEGGTVVTSRINLEGCEGTLMQRWAGAETLLAEVCAAPTGVQASYAAANTAVIWHAGGVETIDL